MSREELINKESGKASGIEQKLMAELEAERRPPIREPPPVKDPKAELQKLIPVIAGLAGVVVAGFLAYKLYKRFGSTKPISIPPPVAPVAETLQGGGDAFFKASMDAGLGQ